MLCHALRRRRRAAASGRSAACTGIEWEDTGEVEFHLPPGELIDVLRENGFEVERLVELYAPEDASTHDYYDYVTAEWARKWPAEEIWVARKRA